MGWCPFSALLAINDGLLSAEHGHHRLPVTRPGRRWDVFGSLLIVVSVIAASSRLPISSNAGRGPFQRNWSTSSNSMMSVRRVARVRKRKSMIPMAHKGRRKSIRPQCVDLPGTAVMRN